LSNLHNQVLPGKEALIVTSAGSSVKKYGYLSKLEEQLKISGIEFVLFDKVVANPTKAQVMEAARLSKDCGCDFVIGLGGGSSIDSAKAIAIMSVNDGDYWDYVSENAKKTRTIISNPLPVVAITTTAGTGTEADPWMVITNTDTNEKIGSGNEKTFPVLSIVDPDLMMSVPASLTAYQGFDALFHSTEGYINITANPVSDMFALKSISLIGKSLVAAVNNGNDTNARADVALANTFSGLVESTSGCTSEHSIEHAMSGLHPKLPHGAGLIMISKAYYTKFADSGACDERLVEMAKALGCATATEPMDFVKTLENLQSACYVNQLKMSDYGITKSEFPDVVKLARRVAGALFDVDAIQLTDNDVISILEKSYI
jgi:alcohol dehydrogenase